jgi:hypothetical protein
MSQQLVAEELSLIARNPAGAQELSVLYNQLPYSDNLSLKIVMSNNSQYEEID